MSICQSHCRANTPVLAVNGAGSGCSRQRTCVHTQEPVGFPATISMTIGWHASSAKLAIKVAWQSASQPIRCCTFSQLTYWSPAPTSAPFRNCWPRQRGNLHDLSACDETRRRGCPQPTRLRLIPEHRFFYFSPDFPEYSAWHACMTRLSPRRDPPSQKSASPGR